MIRLPLPSIIAAAVLLVALPATAHAGTFDVKSAEVDKGQKEVEFNSSFFRGYPVNAEQVRHSWEAAASYGFTDWFKGGIKLNLDKPIGDDFRASTAGIEGLFLLKKFEKGFGLAWFTGNDFRIHRDETNTVTFGPVLQFGTDKTALLLNPFFAKTYGRNREDGIEFSYAWAAKTEVRENVSIGIEGYGSIPNIGNAPGTAFQEHRIGPVIYLERELGGHGKGGGKGLSIKDVKGGGDDKVGKDADGPKLAIETGVLFGLTAATQDVTFKLKAGISW
jgi:hypothetical protein